MGTQAHIAGTTDTCACRGAVSKAGPGRTGLRRGPAAFRGKVGRTGLGQSLAQLTSLVQNPTGVLGRGGGEWDGCPGTGSIPRPELVTFSRGQTSEMGSVEGRRGGREGPSFPTSGAWAETEPEEKQAGSLSARPGRSAGSLKGLPLLPELLHGAWCRSRGWCRGRAHVLLGFL